MDAAFEFREGFAEKVGDAEGFADDTAELFKDWRGWVGLEVRLAAFLCSLEEIGLGELFEFPLDGAGPEADGGDDLALVEAAGGLAVEESEDAAAG